MESLVFPRPQEALEFSGERYVSGILGAIQHEHYHRYLFASQLCRGREVLDIASGEGYGCSLLGQVAASVTGVDCDEAAISYAARQFTSSNVRFVCGQATDIPLEAESVDVITSFETIEHFDDHTRFIEEVARVLRKDGILIISSPNKDIYLAGQEQNPFHVHELDRAEFLSVLMTKFSHVRLFRQRAMCGSVITPDSGNTESVHSFESFDGHCYGAADELVGAPYFVAVASMVPLPAIAASVMVDNSYVSGLQGQIAHLTAALGQTRSEIEAIRATLKLREHESLDALKMSLVRNHSAESQQGTLAELSKRLRSTEAAFAAERELLLADKRMLESQLAALSTVAGSAPTASRHEARPAAWHFGAMYRRAFDRLMRMVHATAPRRLLTSMKVRGLGAYRRLLEHQLRVLDGRASGGGKGAQRGREPIGKWLAQRLSRPDPRIVAGKVRSYLRDLRRRGKLRPVLAEFDAQYYLRNNPDVAEAGADAFTHYLHQGWREGRDPNSNFSTLWYLEREADVRESGQNPFVHFVLHGRAEGRLGKPHTDDVAPFPKIGATTASGQIAARVIAFYLPQFHPIPENDEWWGRGFTEWTNVRKAVPQFSGHYQPHVPTDTGYYNLLDPSVQERQIELARAYGISGFCFYFYWFHGRRLLHRPVENWLANPKLDFPFCLCWANESWSRRWDGLGHEVLLEQHHSADDDLAFIAEVARYFRDPRYIRWDGKPLLIIYRPSELPSALETSRRWRQWCRDNGIGEIHLSYTQSFDKVDPAVYGFDSAIEFPPNLSGAANVSDKVRPYHSNAAVKVYDWQALESRSKAYETPPYRLFRGVCPSWDNTARRGSDATIFVNNSPELYRRWLANAVADTRKRFADPEKRLIFVNAWNEWAEGAHLEPDERYGHAWLQATRDAVVGEHAGPAASGPKRVVVISHDAHPHGAQFLALHIVRVLKELGFAPDLVSLGDGSLLSRFAEWSTVHRIDLSPASEAPLAKLKELRAKGAEIAIVNSAASGLLLPHLKQAGFRTVTLVHELPGVLESYNLLAHARAVVEHSDVVIFPAGLVQSGFERFVGERVLKAVLQPQGVIRPNPYKNRRLEAHRIVCERHSLPDDARIVLAVAYCEERKGPDYFVEVAKLVTTRDPSAVFIWVGHADPHVQRKIAKMISAEGLSERVRFVGFRESPLEYYAAASAYALTSREDPFPNVVLESAEVGVPVVAFEGATGAAEFIVEHGGALTRSFDVAAYADAVARYLTSPRPAVSAPVPSVRTYVLDLLQPANGRPRVSVIVPNYNYARYLRQRLSSIEGQTFPAYELIILDDASTDGSIHVIRELAEQIPALSVKVIVNSSNSGSVFRQWKKGLEQCSGELVWIAEADDIADTTFLSALVPAFDDPQVVLAFAQSRQIDADGRLLAEDYREYTSDISDAWMSDYVHDGRYEIATAFAVKNTIPNVSAVVFRRAALEKALSELGDKLFDFHVAADWLVYMQIAASGKIAFFSRSLNSHRRHAGSVTKSGAALKHYEEVAEAQRFAATLANVSTDTRSKAERWLVHVRRHLGLDARNQKTNGAIEAG